MNKSLVKKMVLYGSLILSVTACGGSGGSSAATTTVPAVSITYQPSVFASLPASSTPGSLIQGQDGNFYFATTIPAAIYKMTPAGVVTPLYVFDTTVLDSLFSFIQGSDGNFYGTASDGGANNFGGIFKVTPAGVGAVLYSFVGFTPPGQLIQGSDGNLYGITGVSGSGATPDGSVYKLTTTGNLTVLYAPTSYAEAVHALVQGNDGNLYLTSNYLLKMTTAGVLTTLGSVPLANSPTTLLQATNGNFYSLASGGPNNYGTIVQISPSGTETVLYAFTEEGYCPADGVPGEVICLGPEPMQLVQGSDGNFYGTALWGASTANDLGTAGFIFQMTPTGVVTTLYAYDMNDFYADSLITGSNGNLYGMSSLGGQVNIFTIGL